MKDVLLMGGGGREASIANRLIADDPNITLHAIMAHENPTIKNLVDLSGGFTILGDPTNRELLFDTLDRTSPDFGVVSSDQLLAAGMVNMLDKEGIASFGATREAAQIEWDKSFMRELVNKVDPSLNPEFVLAQSEQEVLSALRDFEQRKIPVAIKPLGLTGGKGVKVMGPHFETYTEAETIAIGHLSAGDKGVLIEERIDPDTSVEFTVQAFTDGKTVVAPPPSYDYPYRYDGDTGPGTGSMGAFTERSGSESYLTTEEITQTHIAIQSIVTHMASAGIPFKGVLNVGFFATPDGLKIIECNSRPGDPECFNMMMLANGSMPDVFESIAEQKLSDKMLRFKNAASVVVYITHQQYALSSQPPKVIFHIDDEKIRGAGARFVGASMQQIGERNTYESVGGSRLAAVGAIGDSLEETRASVYEAIQAGVSGPVDYRREVAKADYIAKLTERRRRELGG